MAYVTNMGNEDDKNQPGGPIAPGGAGNTVQLSPNGGVGSTGGATPGASQAQPGGGFASLNQYVNANQGQADPLANKITSDIGNQYTSLQGQNQQTLSGISNQVNSGYTKQNQDVLSQEANNPVSFASNPGNIASFQGQLNDKYTGPNQAEGTSDYQNQLAKVNTAISTGQANTGTDAGRQGLLKQYEAAPTAGVTGLNSAILAQSPTAQSNIENAYKPFSTLTDQLSQGAQGINTQIGQAQNEAQNASSTANKQIADQVGSLTSGLNQNLTAAQKQVQDYNNTVSQTQQSTASPFAALNTYFSQLGINNVTNPFGQYQNQKQFGGTPTLESVANTNDYATANALGQLNPNLTNIPLNQSTAAQAGTFTGPTGVAMTAPNVADTIHNARPDIVKAENTQFATMGGQHGFDPGQQNWLNLENQLNQYLGTLDPNFYK